MDDRSAASSLGLQRSELPGLVAGPQLSVRVQVTGQRAGHLQKRCRDVGATLVENAQSHVISSDAEATP
jgi:hypothetical protein